jgi:hypothetical protein
MAHFNYSSFDVSYYTELRIINAKWLYYSLNTCAKFNNYLTVSYQETHTHLQCYFVICLYTKQISVICKYTPWHINLDTLSRRLDDNHYSICFTGDFKCVMISWETPFFNSSRQVSWHELHMKTVVSPPPPHKKILSSNVTPVPSTTDKIKINCNYSEQLYRHNILYNLSQVKY